MHNCSDRNSFECYIRLFVCCCIIVHIVISHYVVPWKSDFLYGVSIVRLKAEIITDKIAKADSKSVVLFQVFDFLYNPSFEIFNLLLGVRLWISEYDNIEIFLSSDFTNGKLISPGRFPVGPIPLYLNCAGAPLGL